MSEFISHDRGDDWDISRRRVVVVASLSGIPSLTWMAALAPREGLPMKGIGDGID